MYTEGICSRNAKSQFDLYLIFKMLRSINVLVCIINYIDAEIEEVQC